MDDPKIWSDPENGYAWREEQQKADEEEVEKIRTQKRLNEARDLITDRNLAFDDPEWEIKYLRAAMRAEAGLRDIFLAGVEAALDMVERRNKNNEA